MDIGAHLGSVFRVEFSETEFDKRNVLYFKKVSIIIQPRNKKTFQIPALLKDTVDLNFYRLCFSQNVSQSRTL